MSWISLLQMANFVLPFATLPYLTRILLPEKFGTMSFALAIAALLALFCDYGFNWTGVSQVSAKRDNNADLIKIFSEIIVAKMVIFLVAVICLAVLVSIIPVLNRDAGIFLLALTLTFGGVCSPWWFLQGMEQMFEFAIASLIARLLSITAIYYFVQSPNDVGVATFLLAIPSTLSALAGLCLVRKLVGGFSLPKAVGVINQFRNGWYIFIGTITVGLYTGAQVVVVGALGGPVLAGYYASADKCLSAGKALLAVVTQSSVPRVSYLAKHDPARGLKLIRSLLWMAPAASFASILMIAVPEVIVETLFGQPFVEPVAPLLRVLSPVPVFVSLTSCFASLYMINYGHQKLWGKMLFGASIASLISTALAVLWFPAHIAAAIGVTMAEGFVTAFSAIIFIKTTKPKI